VVVVTGVVVVGVAEVVVGVGVGVVVVAVDGEDVAVVGAVEDVVGVPLLDPKAPSNPLILGRVLLRSVTASSVFATSLIVGAT
jgi:hypothetical protein